MVGITLMYVIATIVICVFNILSTKEAYKQTKQAYRQLEESQRQQKQNVGLQLYNIRKEALRSFSEKKYNEIYWDVSILFNESIFDDFSALCGNETRIDLFNKRLFEFKKHIKEVGGDEEFELFNMLEKNSNTPNVIGNKQNDLYNFCDKYSFTKLDDITNEVITYNYRDLTEKATTLERMVDSEHLALFLQMRKYIKDSLNLNKKGEQ